MPKPTHKRYTLVDLFCGSGAVSEAFKQHKFNIVAAVDNDPGACETYAANHSDVKLYREDITNINPHDILKDLNGRELDVLVVCAPCQPFSSQNKKKGNDPRASLILQAIRFAEVLKPRLIFFENVPGIASPKNAFVIKELSEGLGKEYSLSEPQRVDAADYGVPQRRNRCIMIAVRGKKNISMPAPTTPVGNRVTVKMAIGELPKLSSGEVFKDDALHAARTHQSIALERLAYIPKNGGSRFSLPPRLVLKCHKNHDGHPDVYGRMRWEDVAPTLTTGCTDLTKGRYAHPEADRAITLREAALLQTFPKEYKFVGTPSSIAEQIGNAVPVKMVEAFIPTFKMMVDA